MAALQSNAVMTNNSLLPPNHTQFEKDLETVSSRISDIPVTIRDIWNPDTCPLELLPWLAWALSIDSWKDYWPESVKRARLRNAIAISRIKGTPQSLKDVVRSFGVEMEIDEVSEDLAPFQFNIKIDVNNVGAQNSEFTRDVVEEISRTKRSSSYFELQQQVKIAAPIAITGRVRVARFIRFSATIPESNLPTDLGNMKDPIKKTIDLGSMNDPHTKIIDLGVM
jgi:phage tail P2-like protein